jgi:hypothetical protein
MIPPECRLHEYHYMPVMIGRLFGSEFHARANDSEWRAGVTLWLKSWHQSPAASLPDDDVLLARLAEFGRDVDSWLKVRDMALHGWVKAEDGRFYHPVIAELALEAWDGKRKRRDRTQAARAALAQKRAEEERKRKKEGEEGEEGEEGRTDTVTKTVTDNVTDTVTDTVKRVGELKGVHLSEQELAKIEAKHGKAKTAAAIEILDTWLAKPTTNAKAKRAKSHYPYFKADSWVWERAAGNAGNAGVNHQEAAWKSAREAVADAVWRAKESGEDVRQAIRVARDKWGDAPKLDGRDPVEAGVEQAMNNKRPKN